MDSILTSIKKLLGPEENDTNFDTDIIIHINTALMVLNQLGIGPAEGFFITDKSQTWTQFLGDAKNLEAVKTFVYIKVRLIFDPPSSSFVVDAFERALTEIEWRLTQQAEPKVIAEEVVT